MRTLIEQSLSALHKLIAYQNVINTLPRVMYSEQRKVTFHTVSKDITFYSLDANGVHVRF